MDDLKKGLKAFDEGEYETAFALLRPFAEQGNAEAQFAMGWLSKHAEGSLEDYRNASKWYLLAAKQGNPKAQAALVDIYYKSKNYAEAFKWCKLLAEQGYVEAQRNLADMCYKGEGIPKPDFIRAYMWTDFAVSNEPKNYTAIRDKFKRKLRPEALKEAERLKNECIKNNPEVINPKQFR